MTRARARAGAARPPGGVAALVAITATVAAAGLGTALTDAAPSGSAIADTAIRASAGALLALAAARAAPAAVLGAALATAGLATVALDAPVGPLALAMAAAVASSSGPIEVRRPHVATVLRALTGAALAQVLFRLTWPVHVTAAPLGALVATTPVLWSAWRHLGRRPRRAVAWITGATAGLCLVATVLSGLAAASARAAVLRGVEQAEAGLDALSETDAGGRDRAAASLRAAAGEFADAHRAVDAWWARPGRWVPVVGTHTRAIRTMARAGGDLATAAADALGDADPAALTVDGAGVDLARVREILPTVERAWAAIGSTRATLDRIDSPWLLPAVAGRLDDLRERVDEAVDELDEPVRALRLAGDLLGGATPRRYFVLFQALSESRATGGFAGSWGLLTARDGRLSLDRVGRTDDLAIDGIVDIDDPADYAARYEHLLPGRSYATLNYSPDFPVVARLVADALAATPIGAVDGVIATDPVALSGLLRLTGPVPVAEWPEPLSAANAVEVLSFSSYVAFEDSRSQRELFLASAAQATFAAWSTGDLPDVGTVVDVFAPLVSGRHVQLWSPVAAEQDLFADIGADGAWRADDEAGDVVGLVTQNWNGNKIDWFLHRSVAYDVTLDAGSATVIATATIILRNDAPVSGLPDDVIAWGGPVGNPLYRETAPGENLTWLTLYTALPVVSATFDGEPLEMVHQPESGLLAHSAYVPVPSGATRTLQVQLAGGWAGTDAYRLRVLDQATLRPDDVRVDVRAGGGAFPAGATATGVEPAGAGAWRLTGPADRDLAVSVTGVAASPRRSWWDRLRGA